MFQQYQKLVDDESWEIKYESNETVLLVKKDSLPEKVFYGSPKDFLVNAVEVGSANDFHIFYDNTAHKLKIQKVNFAPADSTHKFMVETILDENGADKRIDDGFDLNSRMLVRIGNSSFFEYSLPKGKIKDVRVGQYYFDGTWKYPWRITLEGSQLSPY